MFLLLFPLLFQDESTDTLIRRLGSDSVEEREEATRLLKARVDDAQRELEKSGSDPDPEVAGRAREILETLTPYRREVCAELTHLRDHGLREAIHRITPSWVEDSDGVHPSRYPARVEWPGLLRTLRETVLVKIDSPADGTGCRIAVRGRLRALRVDLDFEDAGIEEVLDLIRGISGLNVALDGAVESKRDMETKITFSSKDRSLGDVLWDLLSAVCLDYTVTDEGVVLVHLGDRNPDRY
jgi:hypothetical protein